MKKNLCEIIGHIIFIIIVVPLIVNFVLLTKFPCESVGEPKDWLGFFGSYLGGILTFLSAMYVFNKQQKRESKKKEYEESQKEFNDLTYDLGKMCAICDYDIFAFYLLGMQIPEKAYDALEKIEKREEEMIAMYNTFAHKYAHSRGEEGNAFLSTCYNLIGFVSFEISSPLLEIYSKKMQGTYTDLEYQSRISALALKIEKRKSQPSEDLNMLADAWKKEIWNSKELLRNQYIEM